MSEDHLNKAFRLIEADELSAARAVLQPLLAEEPDNPDAWWLYAHAVTDTGEARTALDNVLRIDPDYPGAHDLYRTLETKSSVGSTSNISIGRITPAPVVDDLPEDLPLGDDFDDGLPDFDDDEKEPSKTSSILKWVALVAIVLVVIALVFSLLNGGAPAESPTPTSVAAVVTEVAADETEAPTVDAEDEAATEEATAEEDGAAPLPFDEATEVADEGEVEATVDAQVVETEEATDAEVTATEDSAQAGDDEPVTTEEPSALVDTTEEAVQSTDDEATTPEEPASTEGDDTDIETADAQAALLGAFSAFSLPEDAVAIEDTDAGETLLVTVCSGAGQSLRETLPASMDVIANQLELAPETAEAVGIRAYNCDTDNLLLTIVVPRDAAESYVNGELDTAAFEQFWLPQ